MSRRFLISNDTSISHFLDVVFLYFSTNAIGALLYIRLIFTINIYEENRRGLSDRSHMSNLLSICFHFTLSSFLSLFPCFSAYLCSHSMFQRERITSVRKIVRLNIVSLVLA